MNISRKILSNCSHVHRKFSKGFLLWFGAVEMNIEKEKFVQNWWFWKTQILLSFAGVPHQGMDSVRVHGTYILIIQLLTLLVCDFLHNSFRMLLWSAYIIKWQCVCTTLQSSSKHVISLPRWISRIFKVEDSWWWKMKIFLDITPLP